MPGILFHELPLDILLLIFDYLDHRSVVSLSLCRSLKAASDAYLRHHQTVRLVVGQESVHGEYSIHDLLEQLAGSRLVAHSIRKILVTILPRESSPYQPLLSWKTRDCLRDATRFISYLCQQAIALSKHGNDVSRWLLLVPFICSNLETLSVVTQDELDWLHLAQHLGFTQWPHYRLTHLEITWINTAIATGYNRHHKRHHDLQDIWLLISAPALKSITLNGLEQNNNLYSGAADRAAIRTTYWPVELEIFSLYHHSYQGLHSGTDNILPSLPTKSPFAHEFVHLEALNLHNFSAPKTWLPLLLRCFKSLRCLKISVDQGIVWRQRQSFPFDFRLLKTALHQLITLEEVTINISIPKERPEWLVATGQGQFSIGSLDQLQQLRVLNLPWFMWLPCEVPNADSTELWGTTNVRLPPKLEALTLSGCCSSQVGGFAKLITAAIPSQGLQTLRHIVLQTAGDFTFKQVDFAHFISETGSVEIVSEENGPYDPIYSIILRLGK